MPQRFRFTVEVFGSDQYLKQAGKPSINKHKKLFIWISRTNSVNRKVLALELYCRVYSKVMPFKLYYILQKHLVAWYVYLIPLLYHGTTVMFLEQNVFCFQNKHICLHNIYVCVCVCAVYIYFVNKYKDMHVYIYIFKKNMLCLYMRPWTTKP